uniref:Uncharacterized protein n=1 Tax=Anopheles culicifacies TaxID=139723 RepID=A0A182LY65_9DIPT
MSIGTPLTDRSECHARFGRLNFNPSLLNAASIPSDNSRKAFATPITARQKTASKYARNSFTPSLTSSPVCKWTGSGVMRGVRYILRNVLMDSPADHPYCGTINGERILN